MVPGAPFGSERGPGPAPRLSLSKSKSPSNRSMYSGATGRAGDKRKMSDDQQMMTSYHREIMKSLVPTLFPAVDIVGANTSLNEGKELWRMVFFSSRFDYLKQARMCSSVVLMRDLDSKKNQKFSLLKKFVRILPAKIEKTNFAWCLCFVGLVDTSRIFLIFFPCSCMLLIYSCNFYFY